MDAVITGVVGGGTISLLLVVGGAVALWSNLWEKFSSPQYIFTWLCFLTSLTIGQLYLTYVLTTAFAATPSQTDKAIVS
jgi:hypothetical protein